MKKNILFYTLWLLSSQLFAQAVTSDNDGSGTTGINTVSSLSISLTVPANNNRLLVACVANSLGGGVPAVTYNGRHDTNYNKHV
jgi:hypothetical protein